MLFFEIRKYLNTKYYRIIAVLFVAFIFLLTNRTNVSVLFIPEGSRLNIHDYIIGCFNSTQFIMFCVFPMLFAVLTSDLITSEINDKYIHFIIPRMNNRLNYLLNKFILMMLIAIFFTICILIFQIIISIIFDYGGVDRQLFNPVFSLLNKHSLLYIYLLTIIYFILGLILVGLISILLSLYFNKAVLVVGSIFFISIIHNALLVTGDKFILQFMPFSQYIVGFHNNFSGYTLDSKNFSLKFSIIYYSVSIPILIFLIIRNFKNRDIS